jgi:hypothetical protein
MGLNTASLRGGIITLAPSEDKIVLLAEWLGQEKDELLALAGKVRALDLTPWPRLRLPALRGRREGRRGVPLSLSEGD